MITKEDIGEKLLSVLEKYDATQQYLEICNKENEEDQKLIIDLKDDKYQLGYSFVWSDDESFDWYRMNEEVLQLFH